MWHWKQGESPVLGWSCQIEKISAIFGSDMQNGIAGNMLLTLSNC